MLIFVVLLTGLTGLPGLAGAQALWDSDRVVEIDSSFQSVLLDPKLDYLEDSGAMLSIKEVLAEQQQVRFVPNRQGIFSAGYTDSSYWFRFRLLNREERVQRLILLRERDSIEIKAWKVKGSVAPELIWDKGPLPAQQGLSRQQRLGTEVELAPLETVEVYLKLRVLADLKAVLTLWSPG
ncbi:MAG: 7TMR-DISMED2 domain-containing protein, partial [bacterium]